MKINVIVVLLVCCSFQSVFSQEKLSLTLKVDTKKTVNETEHFYLMEITNNANTSLKFNISTENTKCQNTSSNKQVLLKHHNEAYIFFFALIYSFINSVNTFTLAPYLRNLKNNCRPPKPIIPTKFPIGKFNAGVELSIPSTNCINLLFENVANPLVFTDLNVKLLVFTSTPFRFSRPP